LELIEELHIPRDAAVIDIGGGASLLADCLVERHFSDVTVLDLSEAALRESQHRLGGSHVIRLHEDVLHWDPPRRYDLWHDRALFHFLVTDTDRRRYVETMYAALRPGGFVILATFAADGPELCSGLPVTRYSVKDLSLVLDETFDVLVTRREVHTTPHGASQPFTWLAGRNVPRSDAI
jgi:cyclopropane fatty-acyl-phospholipid synthase-like methyltransferase